MLRPARLIMMVLLAMFVVAVPTAIAQDPVTDQYSAVDPGGAGAGAGDGAGAGTTEGAAPVQVREITAAQADKLPFTGGQISLIALIGLVLLAAGALSMAASRRRSSATAA